MDTINKAISVINVRKVVAVLCAVGISFIGWKSYLYFCDTTPPVIALVGAEAGRWYAGEMQCAVKSSKSGDVSVWLDGKPLVTCFSMCPSDGGHPFIIPTCTVANGKHTLKLELCDTTYNKNSAVLERDFHVDNVALQGTFVQSEQEQRVLQGRTLHVQFQVNKDIERATVSALSEQFNCFPEAKNSRVYEAFIPVACEEKPSEYMFTVNAIDCVGNTLCLESTFQVVPFPFKKQTIAISDQRVKEEEELGDANQKLEEQIERLTCASPQCKLWRGEFCTPIDIDRITCEYGTVRTTQQKGRYAHKALDVISAPKSVVWASQSGIVALKERFSETGNTVIIDHGCGLLSLFFHLDDFAKIEVGEKIAKGNPVGTLGKTGYATGYHLHWEMRLGNIPVDPMQWTKATF